MRDEEKVVCIERLLKYTQPLLGLAEFASILGVSNQACSNRLSRGKLLEPTARLRMGPIWTRQQIVQWLGASIQPFGARPHKHMPDFKSHDERDKYFTENADYFTCIRKTGVGNYERSEHESLEAAKSAAQAKKVVTGGRYLIYAVINEQSALAGTVG